MLRHLVATTGEPSEARHFDVANTKLRTTSRTREWLLSSNVPSHIAICCSRSSNKSKQYRRYCLTNRRKQTQVAIHFLIFHNHPLALGVCFCSSFHVLIALASETPLQHHQFIVGLCAKSRNAHKLNCSVTQNLNRDAKQERGLRDAEPLSNSSDTHRQCVSMWMVVWLP